MKSSLLYYFRNLFFVSFILTDKLFAKALCGFKTGLLVSNNLCGKLVSSLLLPIIFEYNLRVAAVSVVIANFNFSIFELDNWFTLWYLYQNENIFTIVSLQNLCRSF